MTRLCRKTLQPRHGRVESSHGHVVQFVENRNDLGITHTRVLRHGRVKKPHGRVAPASLFPFGIDKMS